MSCPNCAEPLQEVSYDNQKILHCSNCGGSFFEDNGINRITLGSAAKLSEDKENTIIMGLSKYCPRDKTMLNPITNDEAVPADVTLLRCESCHGIFAYPDDLMNFKKAQNAKLDYYRIWNKPLPSIRSILLLGMILITGMIGFISITNIRQSQISNSQASDIIQKFTVTNSGRYILISFKTSSKVKSSIEFYSLSNGSRFKKIISDVPVTSHIFTTGDLDVKEDLYYQIILTDGNNNEVKTGYKKLETK